VHSLWQRGVDRVDKLDVALKDLLRCLRTEPSQVVRPSKENHHFGVVGDHDLVGIVGHLFDLCSAEPPIDYRKIGMNTPDSMKRR
jgi:hypothetical protein